MRGWGKIQRHADFYPYGGERQVCGTLDDPHKFAGMEYDPESGLHHTLYRQYSPTLGRWLSTDPLGVCGGSCGAGKKAMVSMMPDLTTTAGCTGSCNQIWDLSFPVSFSQNTCTSSPQALNLYAYVENSPANLTDPSGGYDPVACGLCFTGCSGVFWECVRGCVAMCRWSRIGCGLCVSTCVVIYYYCLKVCSGWCR